MEPSQTSSPLTEGPWGRGGLVTTEESIKLIPKIRPSTTPGLPDYVKYIGHKALTLSAPGAENAHWDFDFVASPHTRQSSFFRVAGRPMADHFLAFFNAAIIAYGQTGSGKTHTMLGSLPSDWTTRNLSSVTFDEMPREAGLIPRVLAYIFQRIAAESNGDANVKQLGPAPAQRELPAPPPVPAPPTCSTPITDNARARGRSGIPTPNGLPRTAYLTPPPASPQTTPEAAHGPSLPSSRSKYVDPGNAEYRIKASMLQIYQEVVTDLLNPRPVRLQIRESMEDGVMVVGLSEVTVRSAAEALQLLRVGTSHRAVAETASNSVSSRSHCILTLHMEAKDKLDTGVVRIRRSRLQLVDLAGSERTAKGADHGSARQKETNAINKSLSTLGLVIARLTDRTRSQGPVPYRDSKLTFLLQDCLGGNAKTLIIANLNPSPTCSSETNMTLGFALRAKRVRNRAVVNEDHRGDAVVLQGEVRRLREELCIFRTLLAKDEPPQGIEELSAWRDQAAARESQLHQALQLNGELEEKLAAMDAAHSRLRMEHASLEEQCDAQRCEMSALEATVEQCTDELHELRERPTFEQLQAVEGQLRCTIRERDGAWAQHAEALQRCKQLEDQCMQLTKLLETFKAEPPQNMLNGQHNAGRPGLELPSEMQSALLQDSAPSRATVLESDYSVLQQAYHDLKGRYATLVEHNRQLMSQLSGAAGILEAAADPNGMISDNSVAAANKAGAHPMAHQRYKLSNSYLVSGCLEAVVERTEDEYEDGCFSHASGQACRTESPSEQVRLASPTYQGCSFSDDAASADPVAPTVSTIQGVLGLRTVLGVDDQNQMFIHVRRRCCSGGSGSQAQAPADGNVAAGFGLRHSLPGAFPNSHHSCDSAPPALTNIRQLYRLACSRPVKPSNGSRGEEDGDDAADARSLGAVVRVNPLFECRHGEDRLRSASHAENGSPTSAGTAEVNSGAVQKSIGSAEAPAGSDSIACELPMPPDEQMMSPLAQGVYHSEDTDSTAGVVLTEGSAEYSILSDARGLGRALQDIHLPNIVTSGADLRESRMEPSLTVTPCSHPYGADPDKLGPKAPQVVSPSRRHGASTCATASKADVSPESPMACNTAAPLSASKASGTVSRAARAALRASSPLTVVSSRNDENVFTPMLGAVQDGRAFASVREKQFGTDLRNLQSVSVTGVLGPSSLGFRQAYSISKTDETAGDAVQRGRTNPSALVDSVSGDSRSRRSAGTEQCAGLSWLGKEQLEENVAQLEDELARRLQGEIQLRMKLQEALTEAQSAGAQAASLQAQNNGLIEEITERDERLRCYEDLVSRFYNELKTILRHGRREVNSPMQHTRAVTATSVSSPADCITAMADDVPTDTVLAPETSEPVTVSPAERPRVLQSYETGVVSPVSCGMDGTPRYFIPRPAASGSASLSSSFSHGSRDAGVVHSPLDLMVGSVQVEGPNSAMKTRIMLLLAKLRDGLLERDQRTAGLEDELCDARSRLQLLEQELKTLQRGVLSRDAADDWADQVDGTAAVGAVDTSTIAAQQGCVIKHGFIEPPSPECSDTDAHPPSAWGTVVEQQQSQSSPLESTVRREASLQAQLQSRDCQVFELLERNEQLEASMKSALAEHNNRVVELQTNAARLANNLQAQLWDRDTQITELQTQVGELNASLQRTTAEAVRYRQQSTEAVEQCERYALELDGLERREELLMKKLRAAEMALMHHGQEVDDMRAELTNTAEQLAGMRAKAVAAEVELGHARQIIAALQDQFDGPRRNYGMMQVPPPSEAQQQQVMRAPHYTVATVRPTVMSAGGAPPAGWQHAQVPQGPYMYSARSDGGAVAGHASVYHQIPALGHPDYGLVAQDRAGMPATLKPLGRSSRNMTFAQGVAPPAPIKPGPGQAFGKGGGSRALGPCPAATGTALDHGANKGTWVQRFLCRKGVTGDGSPGQEERVTILTPAKWRTKGMTGIVLRQWVANASGKNTSRKGG